MPSPASSSLSSANGRDPTGIVRQLRHRMQRLDLSASVAHTARVLCMMQLASAVGGGEQSKEHLVCDEFVFCSNFGLLYDDACTAQQQRSIQPHGQIEAKKGAGDCVLM